MKQTDTLRQELMEAPDLDKFLSDNEENFEAGQCGALLQSIFTGKAYSKAELARQSGMSTVYLYQVFSGIRRPSRDKLICICFGLGCSLDTTQELLKKCGYSALYAKNRRDAIMMYSLNKGSTLQETNDRLIHEKEESLL